MPEKDARKRCWMLDARAFKKSIYHFPFVILDFTLKEIRSVDFSSNENSKITNGK